MALSGHRRTSSHKRRRAAHFALKKQRMVRCSQCKTLKPPAIVCGLCGAYKGKTVVTPKSKKKEGAKKKK